MRDMKNGDEEDRFDAAMEMILRVSPETIREAMEVEKEARKAKRAASGPVSSSRNA